MITTAVDMVDIGTADTVTVAVTVADMVVDTTDTVITFTTTATSITTATSTVATEVSTTAIVPGTEMIATEAVAADSRSTSGFKPLSG